MLTSRKVVIGVAAKKMIPSLIHNYLELNIKSPSPPDFEIDFRQIGIENQI